MVKRRATHRELTADEREAVEAYAQEKGPQWKRSLLNDWMRAARPGVLQRLRNELGPKWLATFKL